ncbi:OLC1v1025715C1 [Oldenlandia corymbosa var. corymbosa]|uniref:ER membrane protein complex subunit 10 n=1 Tax=Oldenlandia corymbosa var. corymbosa TaxID=529605 RepID=A0AAV1C7S7_OLDCO|nr:OLC1v1025715C1 [Oldenlandia corymbosa var. corymbosa]
MKIVKFRRHSARIPLPLLISLSFLLTASFAFQSDELLVDDEEFGLEGGSAPRSTLDVPSSVPSPPSQPTKKRSSEAGSGSESDSKIQFSLEHAFGDSDFSPAGTFTARLKNSPHSGQTLAKLRFSRLDFTEAEKENFKKLLEDDDFYKIRIATNLLTPPGRDHVVSSVKARCLPRNGLDEHIVIHMDGVNVLAVNYGSQGACQYPRSLKFPKRWSFNSRTFLKNSELAPRTPVFSEDIGGGENAEGEAMAPPERTFWQKYWMYLIPLGLVVMNAITQAMNMAEEQQGGGQAGSQVQPRGQPAAVRRR